MTMEKRTVKPVNHRRINKRKTVLSVLATMLMIIWAFIAMLPFAFMFCSSLKPGEEMLRHG